MTDVPPGVADDGLDPGAPSRTWWFVLVGLLAVEVAPLGLLRLTNESPPAAQAILFWLGVSRMLAGPVAGAFILGRTWRQRLTMAGIFVVWLAGAYLVSQHRPDSIMPPPPADWIIPYAWLASAACGATFLIQRRRRTAPPWTAARTTAGVVTLGFAMFYSCCSVVDDERARPNIEQEAPLPPGWREASWSRYADGYDGFFIDAQPPAGLPRDEARRQLTAFLCEKQRWCTPCRPVRGLLPWGRHCLTITDEPDDPNQLRVTVLREGVQAAPNGPGAHHRGPPARVPPWILPS
jgi:hypothetical protein